MNTARRFLGATGVGLAALVLVSGCSGSSGGGGFQEHTQNNQGDSSVRVGANAKIPADFPAAAVPLPEVGSLQAVVTGKSGRNHTYTLTYGLGGMNGVAAGRAYRDRLDKAGYKIKNYSSTQGSDGGFTTFAATSDKWDLEVVSGKATRLEPLAMSVQIVTHGTLSDLNDLNELDILGNDGNSPSLNPDDPNATSTTSIPLNGG